MFIFSLRMKHKALVSSVAQAVKHLILLLTMIKNKVNNENSYI